MKKLFFVAFVAMLLMVGAVIAAPFARFQEGVAGDFRIAIVGNSFKTIFTDSFEVEEQSVRSYRLADTKSDRETYRQSPGGEVELGSIYAMLRLQGNGQPGRLATNGKTNLFFVVNSRGITRAVSALFYNGHQKPLPILPPKPIKPENATLDDSLKFIKDVQEYNAVLAEWSYVSACNQSIDYQRGWMIDTASLEASECEHRAGTVVWLRN